MFFFFLLTHLYAFTLNNNIDAGFSSAEIQIYVTSNSDCINAGISKEKLLDLAVSGGKKFWNKIPSTKLKIRRGGIYETDNDLFQTGILCVNDSDSDCDEDTSVPKAQRDIIIACNSETDENFKESSILALTLPNHLSGGNIKGSVILINDSNGTAFDRLTHSEIRNVLAHEIGHAVGLGHSQTDKALMYYKDFSQRHKLGQDDIDGITYLYPRKFDSCGFFGTLQPMQTGMSFSLGAMIIGLIRKLLKRFKRA